jgi:hypothetical protein
MPREEEEEKTKASSKDKTTESKRFGLTRQEPLP